MREMSQVGTPSFDPAAVTPPSGTWHSGQKTASTRHSHDPFYKVP